MIHIAVLLKPYLDAILEGRKTVECRLTRQPRTPYDRIERGDRIFFKQSCGPYRATAIADHVQFECDLTPSRIRQIRRDYDELLCGNAEYWRLKRDSRYCTLIWLKDVRATETGPAIRRLQGAAWLTMADTPAWTKPRPPRDSFTIEVTSGNLRNNSLYVTGVLDRFPESTIGGPNKSEAGAPVTLMLHDGPTLETDIVGPRNLLRTRRWGDWFRRHGARSGDHVVFTPVDDVTFFVALARTTSAGRQRT